MSGYQLSFYHSISETSTENLIDTDKDRPLIEHVMTYGWITFVVVVLSIAAVSAVLSSGGCESQLVSQDDGNLSIALSDKTKEIIEVELINTGENPKPLRRITLNDQEGDIVQNKTSEAVLQPEETEKLDIEVEKEDNSCTRFDISISYGEEGESSFKSQIKT